LRIGQLATRSGRSQSAIRYYEAQGLLVDVERVGGRREFRESAVQTMRVIDIAQRGGFSLAEIRVVLEQGSGGSSTLAHLATRKGWRGRRGDRRSPGSPPLAAHRQWM